MQINKSDMLEFANIIATAVVEALEKKNVINIGSANSKMNVERSAYQKSEALLYSYRNFQKLIKERLLEIEELKKYGVPRSSAVKEYVQRGNIPQGIITEEESVDSAVATVQRSMERTVEAVQLIDKAMESLKNDPYYKILEWIYFEGRTQEDVAAELNCSQGTISNNRKRLVKELSLRLFPNQAINEMLS